MADPRFSSESGFQVFNGNELILKGGLEGGVALLTGYPGSPVSDIFDAIYANRDLLLRYGILGQIANNEALAAARLNGARLSQARSIAVMKSVGMHVAADAIAIGNLVEPNQSLGGALIVVGDDPWNETTQVNSDSRYLATHLHTPILAPATFQEIKDWIDIGFELSGECNLYVTYLLTTSQADGGASVRVKGNRIPSVSLNQKTELSSLGMKIEDHVMIPPHTSQKELTLNLRKEKFIRRAKKYGLNKICHWQPGKKYSLGFISAGLPYCYLEHALFEMDLAGKFPILKLGVLSPLDKAIVQEFLESVETVIVIEEKRPYLEDQIRSLLQELSQEGSLELENRRIYGKKFPKGVLGIPETLGIHSSLLIERLGPLFLNLNLEEIRGKEKKIEAECAQVFETSKYFIPIPLRTPTFCSGCPHRDSAVVSLQMKKDLLNGAKPVDLLFHGESGCHSMLQFAPNEGLMQNYSGMGLGGGTGAGIDPFITNKQVVFLGDSTFFHSGMVAVSDSIKNHQDITYVILDNKTTAMTGHQPTPGNDFDLLGRKTLAQNIESVVRGIGGGETVPIIRTDPADRENYRKLLEELVLKEGVKIVIADKECGITYQRRINRSKKQILKEQGYIEREEKINITPEVCEYCLECTKATGCPGLTIEETDFGPKIQTDLTLCVSDGACMKGRVCPSFEKIIITRSKPPEATPTDPETKNIPLPNFPLFDGAHYISTFAVGGMGAGVVSAILVRAGLKENFQVEFLDKKGLAIRNGGVYSHIVYSKNKDQVLSPTVPYGKANLILGMDLLETARGLDPKMNLRVANPKATAAVVNSHKTETILTLTGRDSFNPLVLDQAIQSRTKKEGYFSFDYSLLSEKLLGSKLYTNLFMIGSAFQMGLLPISLHHIISAICDTVSYEDQNQNLKAFHFGRELVTNPEKFLKLVQREKLSYPEIMEQKYSALSKRVFRGKRIAQKFRKMVEEAVRWMHLDENSNRALALRTYELIQYEGGELAEQYLSLLWDLYRKDRFDYSATKAAIENLFKVMLIKDEVYVAHLLTTPEKFKQDRLKYKIDPANGDKVDYIHMNKLHLSFFGFKFEINFNSRNWMLVPLKYCKFVRKLIPLWHSKEKEFRDGYIELVKNFNYFEEEETYQRYVKALKSPEKVSGYRAVRYKKMEELFATIKQVLPKKDLPQNWEKMISK